jgi:hypothetical protein
MDRIERQCFVRPALQLSSFVIGQGDRKPHPDSPERMQKRKGRPDVCLYASLSISVIGAVPNSRPANKTCETEREEGFGLMYKFPLASSFFSQT